MIWKLILISMSAFLITGCTSSIEKVEESSSVITLLILLLSLSYLYFLPRLQTWKISQKLIFLIIVRPAYYWISILMTLGVFSLFLENPIGKILSISLFISSALMFRMKSNYHNKSDEEKISDLKYVTITIPPNLVLIFLLTGGLQKLLG